MAQHRVVFGEGQQPITHVPRVRGPDSVRLASLSSITFSIEDLTKSVDDADRVVASGTPVSGTETDVTDAIVGRGQSDPKVVSLVDVTGFVKGRPYLIKDDSGQEIFTAKHIDATGDSIIAETGLTGQYASGATVESVTLTAQFPASHADDLDIIENREGGPFEIRWGYTYDSDKWLVPEEIWVVRTSVQPWITEDELKLRDPTMVSRVKGDANRYGQAIHVAMDDVLGDLNARGIDPSRWRTSQVGKNMLFKKALSYLYMWKLSDKSDERAEKLEESYQGLLQQVTVGRDPVGTVVINPSTDEAPEGTSRASRSNIIREL